jgi:hypothetical protein
MVSIILPLFEVQFSTVSAFAFAYNPLSLVGKATGRLSAAGHALFTTSFTKTEYVPTGNPSILK